MILIDKYVDFITKHGLTTHEFLVLSFVFYGRKDLIEKYKEAFQLQAILTDEQKAKLTSNGFLTYSDGTYKITSKFTDIFVDKDVATEEVFKIYPVSMEHQGVTIPLKAMDRSVFAVLYQNAIMGSYEEHCEVLQDIQYGKEHKMLNIGIEKFVKSKYWLSLRELRLDKKERLNTNTSIDNEFNH